MSFKSYAWSQPCQAGAGMGFPSMVGAPFEDPSLEVDHNLLYVVVEESQTKLNSQCSLSWRQ